MEEGQALEEAGPRRDNTAAVPKSPSPFPHQPRYPGRGWLRKQFTFSHFLVSLPLGSSGQDMLVHLWRRGQGSEASADEADKRGEKQGAVVGSCRG